MKKRTIILLTSMLLVVLLIAGGTFAYFTYSTRTVTNEFKAGTVKVCLADYFYTCGARNVNPGDCIYKQVYACNTGSKKAMIRINLLSEFEGMSDTAHIGVVDYNLDDRYWKMGEDGWAYYKYMVNPGCCTHSLFACDRVCFDGFGMNNDYQGKKFTIKVKAEAVQATNGAPTAVWGQSPWATRSEMAEAGGLEDAPRMSDEMAEFLRDNPPEADNPYVLIETEAEEVVE